MKIVEIKVHVRLQNKLQKELIYEMCLCNGTIAYQFQIQIVVFLKKLIWTTSSYLKKITVSNKGIIFK